MKPKEGVGKISQPAHEENNHEPVNVNDEIIDVFAVLRGKDREAEEFIHGVRDA